MIAQAREAVCDPAKVRELLEDYDAATVFDALLEVYAGVTNGFLSKVCETISGTKVEVTGTPEPRLPCPCCHRRTLTERYNPEEGTGYDICDYCGWEDDGTSNADALSSANHGTMAEYRERISRESNYYDQEKWLMD